VPFGRPSSQEWLSPELGHLDLEFSSAVRFGGLM
jgi:hypothetical protein